jgi:hypothetical protein
MSYLYFVVEEVGAVESVEKPALPNQIKAFPRLKKWKTGGKTVESLWKRKGKTDVKFAIFLFFLFLSAERGFFWIFPLFHNGFSLWKEEKQVVFLRIRKGFPQERNSAFPLFPFQYLQSLLRVLLL